MRTFFFNTIFIGVHKSHTRFLFMTIVVMMVLTSELIRAWLKRIVADTLQCVLVASFCFSFRYKYDLSLRFCPQTGAKWPYLQKYYTRSKAQKRRSRRVGGAPQISTNVIPTGLKLLAATRLVFITDIFQLFSGFCYTRQRYCQL